MGKLYTPTPISNIYSSVNTINQNWDDIADALDLTLARDGSTPNQMEDLIDMNSNDIINAGAIYMDQLFVDGARIPSLQEIGETYADMLVALAAGEAAQLAAEQAQAGAETAETNAVAAQTAAETAQTAAELAETNAEASETAAATSASNAATSESNAAQSATDAETAQTNAETAETNAATSETNAAQSATDAQTAQIAAELAETNAETAESNTQAIVDNFFSVVDVSTGKTVTSSDNRTVQRVTAAATITLPEDSTENLPAGFTIEVMKDTTGTVDFAVEGTDVLRTSAGTEILTQYNWATAVKIASGVWAIYGDL
tara:strand:- start:17445 stop:18395 length:951 start_codon:yes stop_codon:yes gene_type:complete